MQIESVAHPDTAAENGLTLSLTADEARQLVAQIQIALATVVPS